MGGAFMGKVTYCFQEICSKNTGLQGSTLSDHHMIMKEGGWRGRSEALEAKGEELPRKENISLYQGDSGSDANTP